MPPIIATLLGAFDAAYQARHEVRYPFLGGKEAKLMAGLLKLYTVPQIESFIAAFFDSEDEFIVQTGHSFGAFHSCLPKVIASMQTAKQRKMPRGWIDPPSEAVVEEIKAAAQMRRVK